MSASGARRRRLGVIGTMVWDIIYGRDQRETPAQEWGGITYALAACDVALPDTWELVPLIKVGHDRAPHARAWLRSLRRLAPDAAPIEVPYPNNQVELRYVDAERRSEVLHGGVPPWTWAGLAPLVADLDALYINFISGFEMDLPTAQLVRQHFRRPIYADLHSLLLGVAPDGTRIPQPLSNVDSWCRCFDLVQVNEDELALLAPDGFALAARAIAVGVQCLVVTLGSRGTYTSPRQDSSAWLTLDARRLAQSGAARFGQRTSPQLRRPNVLATRPGAGTSGAQPVSPASSPVIIWTRRCARRVTPPHAMPVIEGLPASRLFCAES